MRASRAYVVLVSFVALLEVRAVASCWSLVALCRPLGLSVIQVGMIYLYRDMVRLRLIVLEPWLERFLCPRAPGKVKNRGGEKPGECPSSSLDAGDGAEGGAAYTPIGWSLRHRVALHC